MAAESVRCRGDGPEAAGANQEGAAGGETAAHHDGETFPRAGRHHRQCQTAAGPAPRGGTRRSETLVLSTLYAAYTNVVSPQVTEGDGDDTDLQIFCVSCSHPINPKVALRHMERCYAKVSLHQLSPPVYTSYSSLILLNSLVIRPN